MPHIRIRSLSESAVQSLSVELPKELAPLMQTTVDNFTVERVATQFFQSGSKVEGDPFIEVLWFERGQEIKNQSALKITELVRRHSSAEYIAVIFKALAPVDYFENGQHF